MYYLQCLFRTPVALLSRLCSPNLFLYPFFQGDILPDESLSFAPREPIARSTSVTHPAAHWGYRSYTDDILKSFIDRPSGFSGAPNFSNDSRLREEGGPDPLSASASLTAPFSVNGSRTDVSRNPLKENSDPFDNSICSNLFNEQQNRHQLDSSEEFVSGEKLLDEFEADQRRCQEENLFKDVSHCVKTETS